MSSIGGDKKGKYQVHSASEKNRKEDMKEKDWNLLSIACTTPSSPYVNEYRNGRPIPTPFAPKHKALITSVPRRAPPSIYTWYQRRSIVKSKAGLLNVIERDVTLSAGGKYIKRPWRTRRSRQRIISKDLRSILIEMWAGRVMRSRGEVLEHKRGYGLTSHFSRISGQFLRISRRVYNAGGAVSSARPLIISHQLQSLHIV